MTNAYYSSFKKCNTKPKCVLNPRELKGKMHKRGKNKANLMHACKKAN
jgi:hypothetical protein